MRRSSHELLEHSSSVIKEINEVKSMAKILVIAMALGAPLAFSHTLLAASDATSKPAEPPVSAGMAMMPMQQQMQGMMKMMHVMMAGMGMMGGQPGGMGMMMPGQSGAPHSGGRAAMAPDTGAMMARMGMMEQRMNMTQMMMDQMLQQQELMLEERSDGDS